LKDFDFLSRTLNFLDSLAWTCYFTLMNSDFDIFL
jgi:hypothetical protein